VCSKFQRSSNGGGVSRFHQGDATLWWPPCENGQELQGVPSLFHLGDTGLWWPPCNNGQELQGVPSLARRIRTLQSTYHMSNHTRVNDPKRTMLNWSTRPASCSERRRKRGGMPRASVADRCCGSGIRYSSSWSCNLLIVCQKNQG